eukprot:TRINITY_DN9717_c0_g1_i1.p3 TRINITY_DN9717_c0_g1~~TRINITY_DN9717_c0_g1_i1.p3  ORF type:complete len:105 (+),score=25.28 TRINITY_DN9717_c0_g1_i1:142-456(+)
MCIRDRLGICSSSDSACDEDLKRIEIAWREQQRQQQLDAARDSARLSTEFSHMDSQTQADLSVLFGSHWGPHLDRQLAAQQPEPASPVPQFRPWFAQGGIGSRL